MRVTARHRLTQQVGQVHGGGLALQGGFGGQDDLLQPPALSSDQQLASFDPVGTGAVDGADGAWSYSARSPKTRSLTTKEIPRPQTETLPVVRPD